MLDHAADRVEPGGRQPGGTQRDRSHAAVPHRSGDMRETEWGYRREPTSE
jgi:hypothetical protein